MKYTITPWRHHSDLLQIRQQLYQLPKDGQDHRRHAVNRVMAWKLRGNLPHAIESTALLIDAILHHHSPENANSTFSIRAVYTAALTRFVTGFCDIGRNRERSLEPSSMLDIAKQIGMPVEFVALRHEATHEEMPGLRRLMKVTEQALGWLWQVYWSKLFDKTEDVASIAIVRDEARRILKEFRTAHRDALRANHGTAAQDVVSKTSEFCVKLCGGSRAKTNALVDVLMEDKLLSPSKRELGASMDGAFLIWDSLLRGIARKQRRFISALVKGMLEAISASFARPAGQDVDKEALSMWLIRIELDETWMAIRSDLEQHDLETEVLMWSSLHANDWTSWLGQKMLEFGRSQSKSEWAEILEASRLDCREAADHSMPDEKPLDAWPIDGTASHSVHSPWSRSVMPGSRPIGVVR
ncbi:hypothetical protein DOTSEDRAFT_124919 [Dothistroma septosporum NZE10]|uniref:Las1-domain-containing protein n=1 Tax=Dothistroma septosporum (strain NZE10 / CBS 128990) TaxID=675120 RepID=N1Q024_DOTSN|nr:hypothetical protein DOTSEDRAFT_124919 [Dothistroma septosporum NZE10]